MVSSDRGRLPLNYWVFLVAAWLSFAAAGAYFGGLPLAIVGMVVGIVVGLALIVCWAADENGSESQEERRAKFGRVAKWFRWSVVATFVLMAILVNVTEFEFAEPLQSYACFGVFVALVVAWVILKGLSLPN